MYGVCRVYIIFEGLPVQGDMAMGGQWTGLHGVCIVNMISRGLPVQGDNGTGWTTDRSEGREAAEAAVADLPPGHAHIWALSCD